MVIFYHAKENLTKCLKRSKIKSFFIGRKKMNLRILKQIVLMAGILSALVATAACPKRGSKTGKTRCAPVVRNCRSGGCVKAPVKSARKGCCGYKTKITIRKKTKGKCSRPIAPGRYRIRFERRSFTNGLERIDFQRPVRTRY